MADEKHPTVYECRFITLSEILTPDEVGLVSNIITNDFTWGDTTVTLVTQEELKAVFDEKATWQRRDVDEMNAVQKVRDAMDAVGDSVYVDLH